MDAHQIPEPVRAAVLSRVEQYGVGPTALGEELLMAEGCATFADFIANIDHRYGPDEGARVTEAIRVLSFRDTQTLGLAGRQGFDEMYRAQVMAENLPRYALMAAPDAEFVNGVEIAISMAAAQHASAGSGRAGEVADDLLAAIDELFAKRGIPYRCLDGRLVMQSRTSHPVGRSNIGLTSAARASSMSTISRPKRHARSGSAGAMLGGRRRTRKSRLSRRAWRACVPARF
jgi:hypothetical protein